MMVNLLCFSLAVKANGAWMAAVAQESSTIVNTYPEICPLRTALLVQRKVVVQTWRASACYIRSNTMLVSYSQSLCTNWTCRCNEEDVFIVLSPAAYYNLDPIVQGKTVKDV